MTSAPVPMARPSSEQLVDLHIYLVPKEVWNEKYRCAYNDVIHQTISAGFLRVWPELSLYYLRNQIIDQLGYDALPSDYVFLKSVGRCLTQVKSKQEFELKVKNFIPPQVPLPEIFVLDAQRDALNLASFTNHERMDLIEEKSFSAPTCEEEPADTEKNDSHRVEPPNTKSRQKATKIPRKVTQAGPKIGTQANNRQTGGQANGQIKKEAGNQMGKRPAAKSGQATGVRAGRQPATRAAGTRIGRLQNATGNSQQKLTRKLAGVGPPRLAPGAQTAQVGRGQAKTSQDGTETGVTSVRNTGRRETSLGNRRKGTVTHKQEGRPRLAPGQASEATGGKIRNRTGISKGVSTEQGCVTAVTRGQLKANVPTNPQELPSSARWAVPQTYTTPTPSRTPIVTPGGVSPLHLQHLEAAKGMDRSTPLKSGRLDTYTNNTNEDSGIAELTPDRNELEYGRQWSDSLERTQRDEKHQMPRTLAIDSRERPESLEHRLQPTEQSELDKVRKQHLEDDTRQESALVQEEERSMQREERERQRVERERQIEDEAGREREEKQRLLESERQRVTERGEKEKIEEEERQRLLKARQQELERRRQEVAAMQEVAAAREEAHQQHLREEEEEREMEEIRKRQADELRQSRQMSWDQARWREMDQFTPHSHRADSSHQRDLCEPSTRDSVRREHTGDLLDRKSGGASTRQSERPQDHGALLVEETGSGVATDDIPGNPGATSDGTQRATESAREKLESERERLLTELQERQETRFELERTREELMRQAKTLQSRTIDRRNKDDEDLESGIMTHTAKDFWKKKYFEEKKKTNPLEEQVNRLRGQLEQQHRKLLNQLEGRGPNRKGMPRATPSKKNDHKILIFKLQHQMDDLKRRVENSKMKLTSEIKLRNQAETELRNLRTDVVQRKINVTVSRSQQLAAFKESEEKQGARTTTVRGTGATSYTPRGTVGTGLK